MAARKTPRLDDGSWHVWERLRFDLLILDEIFEAERKLEPGKAHHDPHIYIKMMQDIREAAEILEEFYNAITSRERRYFADMHK